MLFRSVRTLSGCAQRPAFCSDTELRGMGWIRSGVLPEEGGLTAMASLSLGGVVLIKGMLSHVGPRLKTHSKSAATSPVSPSRCRHAGCRQKRMRVTVSRRMAPPPMALCKSQPRRKLVAPLISGLRSLQRLCRLGCPAPPQSCAAFSPARPKIFVPSATSLEPARRRLRQKRDRETWSHFRRG